MPEKMEGRDSPPPEQQDPKQGMAAPSDGQGVSDTDSGDKAKKNEEMLNNLESNPKGPFEDALKEKFSKTS